MRKDTTNYGKLIFHKIFEVHVPYASTIDDGDIVFNTKLTDKELNTLRPVCLTINLMLDKYRQGHKISTTPETAKEIFNIIQGHINAWEYHMSSSINKKNVPVEDLADLDKFAKQIFELNVKLLASNLESNVDDFFIMPELVDKPSNRIDVEGVEYVRSVFKKKPRDNYDLDTLLK